MTQKKKAIGCFLMSCLTYHSVLLLLPHLPLPHRTRSHVHLTMPCIPSLTMPPLQQVENDDPRPYRSFCSISLSLSLSCITLRSKPRRWGRAWGQRNAKGQPSGTGSHRVSGLPAANPHFWPLRLHRHRQSQRTLASRPAPRRRRRLLSPRLLSAASQQARCPQTLPRDAYRAPLANDRLISNPAAASLISGMRSSSPLQRPDTDFCGGGDSQTGGPFFLSSSSRQLN
ncbi:hypothetical protein M441DRAFT_377365 [Trichoderma asperellum CBS 433.97]|uniref:Uncharacterized protein n=1 Tax=Trichoderma asperellum (strain ATCC 204424 / CBS 433.97 / NBRC 101777) TaxID=1042311 RepID=A0A2T3ZFW8_TRIA4|nr:hypothetical protein M441DRAFT_377365 [Trichoderma asperellum CBS 433.97]PTB43690.1 hypothetical protein M441DRAFT_377365 [Trichoderma asperellum CBS 433.97]